MNKTRRHRDQRGTSTLEFIVVLPTLLVVIFAICEFSRVWLTFNVLTTAVREGARAAVVTDPFDASVGVDRINFILGQSNLTPTVPPTVTCAANPCESGFEVQANATITFQTLFPVFLDALKNGLPLRQRASMRYE